MFSKKLIFLILILSFGMVFQIHSAKLFSIPTTATQGNQECRMKSGYYLEMIPLENGELKIHVEITNEYATFHRIIDKFYVKNKINWLKDCEFELVTLEITDPILLDVDFIGNKTYYKMKQIDENHYQYVEVNKQNVLSLLYQGIHFPHAIVE
ncbi:hypothetical protein AB3N60_07080 [Leptospira sp. WS39.C2]